jgi:puromycin-sensitive aminopeptidase
MPYMSKDVTRLLTQFIPANYKLLVHPEKATMTFTGSVVITGKKTGRPSRRITFHQKGLKISSATVKQTDKDTRNITIDRINLQKSYDEVRLHSPDLIYPGSYEITLEFSGAITDHMNGLYPSRFKLDDKEQIILGTQFESHHAREVFPCIDEPAAKATFDLTVVSPKNEIALGNTPVKEASTTGEWTTTTFETTPIMSSYLLAFVIGDMAYKEAKTKQDVIVRTYATPDKVDQTDFALDVAVRTLEFYDDYFGIAYPLVKCDMVALPDFASGAMENWGCITYREHCMLVDEENTSLPTKQYVAMVVAHELAHQWFGNLVTMRWWTDLWLNEGFASWIEYMAIDHLFPDWHMWTQFIVDEQLPAMKLDALENTHPIEASIHHPDEIRTIFDGISYGKGASVIHMLHDYLGPDMFRKGLQCYLERHSYGNTDTVDLWAALEEVSKMPVKHFMNHWITRPGFPLVTANINTDNPNIKQERFYAQKPATTSEQLWPVPLLASEQLDIQMLEKSVHKLNGSSLKSDFLLNQNGSGFYRVAYDPAHLNELAKHVAAGDFDEIKRLNLLSSQYECAKAGYSNTANVLTLLESYQAETQAPVWDVIAGTVGGVRAVMGDEDNDVLRNAMKPYVRSLVANCLKDLGWKPRQNETYFDTLLRPTILGLAAGADEPTVVKEALKRFKDAKKPEDLAADVRGVILATAARLGDKPEYEKMLAWHDTSTSSEVRTSLCAALTSFEQPALIKKSLSLIKTDRVRQQDVSYWVAYSFMNRHAKNQAWQWLKHEWSWLEENLGTDLSFGRFPVFAARAFGSHEFLKDYTTFFDGVHSPATDRAIKQGAEIIEMQADWKERDYQAVLDFFLNKAKADQ